MIEFLSLIGLAFALFAATNLDEVFVLLAFFADRAYRTRHIVAGQFLGIGVLVVASLLASLVSLVLAPAYVGLLGLLPIAIGIHKLFGKEESEEVGGTGAGRTLSVAGVAIANGGDNLGVYTPVFATSSAAELAVMAAVFTILTAALLAAAHWLVNHPALGAPIRRYGRVATPIVLIAIGVFVLWEAGSFELLRR